MRQAGYHTLFVTSTRSGWRELDRVLKTQGFDEVIDANNLKAAYPEASWASGACGTAMCSATCRSA